MKKSDIKRLDIIAEDIQDFLKAEKNDSGLKIEGTMFISNTAQQSYDTIFYRMNSFEELKYLIEKLNLKLDEISKENFFNRYDDEDINYLIVKKGRKHLDIIG